MMRLLGALGAVLVTLVTFALPATAATPSYFYNPIPVVNGRQYGWSLYGSGSGVNRTTPPATGSTCTNCYAYVLVHTGTVDIGKTVWHNGAATVSYSPSQNVLWITHEVKFKDGNTCYVTGRTLNALGNYTSVWGPTATGC